MDGYRYKGVLIGDQCWFAENLRTTVYADGSAIPEVTDNCMDWVEHGCACALMPMIQVYLMDTACCTTGTPWTMPADCVRTAGMSRPMESGLIWRLTSLHRLQRN